MSFQRAGRSKYGECPVFSTTDTSPPSMKPAADWGRENRVMFADDKECWSFDFPGMFGVIGRHEQRDNGHR